MAIVPRQEMLLFFQILTIVHYNSILVHSVFVEPLKIVDTTLILPGKLEGQNFTKVASYSYGPICKCAFGKILCEDPDLGMTKIYKNNTDGSITACQKISYKNCRPTSYNCVYKDGERDKERFFNYSGQFWPIANDGLFLSQLEMTLFLKQVDNLWTYQNGHLDSLVRTNRTDAVPGELPEAVQRMLALHMTEGHVKLMEEAGENLNTQNWAVYAECKIFRKCRPFCVDLPSTSPSSPMFSTERPTLPWLPSSSTTNRPTLPWLPSATTTSRPTLPWLPSATTTTNIPTLPWLPSATTTNRPTLPWLPSSSSSTEGPTRPRIPMTTSYQNTKDN